MNVCALDVVARTPDFEALAASLELRGWEWDLLHAVDGVSTLATVATHLGIDNDSAIGFVHEAIHRGLLGVATMSLQAYRMHVPQNVLGSPPQKPALSSGAAGTPMLAAPEAAPEKPGSISFSVNAFDWNEPHEPFDESESEAPVAAAPTTPATPGKTITAHVGSVHYDERFGVEHADGPFATAHDEPVHPEVPKSGIAAVAATVAGVSAAAFAGVLEAVTPKEKPEDIPEPTHEPVAEAAIAEPVVAEPAVAEPHVTEEPEAVVVEAPVHEAPVVESAHVEDPFAVAHEPVVAAAVEHVEDPFAARKHDAVEDPFAAKTELAEEPFTAKIHDAVEDPFAAKPHDAVENPFAAKTESVEEPFATKPHDAVEDPFAAKAPVDEHVATFEPFAAASHDAEPVAESAHHDEPFAGLTHDPIISHESEPVAEIAHVSEAAAPSTIAMSIGEEDTFQPIVRHDEPISFNGHAESHAQAEEPVEESAPGSISFSFSAEDPIDAQEESAHDVYEAPVATASKAVFEEPAPPITMPTIAASPAATAMPESVFPEAKTIEHHEDEKPKTPGKTIGETQSTFYEREAIDTDAGRDMEEKAKTWKESLSWREQQEINEAMETGKEKSGFIGSLLRTLGVR